MNTSEVTIKDLWPKLCELGIVELRINNRTVWSDGVMDCMFGRDDYDELNTDYLKRAEEELLGEWYDSFRVTSVNINVVDFHHIVADVTGYYEETEDDLIIEENKDGD